MHKSHVLYLMCSARASNTQKWRNWQTRRLQVPVVAISCGFKSHLLHYNAKQTRFQMEAGLFFLFLIYLFPISISETGISEYQDVRSFRLISSWPAFGATSCISAWPFITVA